MFLIFFISPDYRYSQCRKSQWILVLHMQHCQFYHKSNVEKGKFTHLGGSSVKCYKHLSKVASYSSQHKLFLRFETFEPVAFTAGSYKFTNEHVYWVRKWIPMSKLSYYSLRMHAFSYSWPLPVTWQKWPSHTRIKPYVLHANLVAQSFIEPEWWATEILIAVTRILELFASMTLTLSRWPSYMNLTRIAWRYIRCANTNLLRQGFQKLSSDRHTDI